MYNEAMTDTRSISELLAALEAAQAAANERLAADLADLKAGQGRLEAGQSNLEGSVARLEAGQTRLEAGQTQLEAGQSNLEGSVARLEAGQARLEGDVGRLKGAELEREVHANIVNIASRHLGLNRVRILQSKIVARSPELQDAIDDAEEQGLITDAQGSHLEQTDVILAARRKSDREAIYVAVEISGLIGEHDIDRARSRADTLAIIRGTPVIPAVVGGSIAPPQQGLADRQGVSVVITSRLSS